MVSKASDDFPDPLTPVITTSARCGSVRSTFLRLWVRAPRTTMLFLASRVGGIYSVLFWVNLNSPW